MPRTLPPIAAAAVAVALAVVAPDVGAQVVEAPLYANWARFEVGTTVTTRTTESGPGGTTEATTTRRLVSIDDTKVVIEQVHAEPGAAPGEGQSQTLTIRRWFPLLPGVKREDIGKPTNPTDQGEETLEVGGRTYQATWYDTTGRSEAGPLLTRTWYSDEVPGTVLRAVTRVEGSSSTTTTELVSVSRP